MTTNDKVQISLKAVLLFKTRILLECGHIYHNDCLWCVDDNEGLYQPYDLGANGQGQLSLRSVLLYSKRELLYHFLMESVYI